MELASDQFGVCIDEAEEGAGVVGLEVHHVASLCTAAQISGQQRVPSKLAVERKVFDRAARRDNLASTPRNASPK